jgi:hypothetical protein
MNMDTGMETDTDIDIRISFIYRQVNFENG